MMKYNQIKRFAKFITVLRIKRNKKRVNFLHFLEKENVILTFC